MLALWTAPLIFLLVGIHLSESKLNPPLIKHILEFHNTVRAEIANGNISHPTFKAQLPKASGMRVLEWWPRLATAARRFSAEQCWGHEVKTVNPLDVDVLVAAVKMAVGSVTDSLAELLFRVSEPSINNSLDHSHPIMDEKMVRIGCALRNCSKKGQRHLVCVYASERIVPLKKGYKTYEEGDPCGTCPTGNDYCVNNALCATRHQCQHSNSRCDCLINAEKCEVNGGYFDLDNCQCVCQSKHATGLHCETQCEDEKCKLESKKTKDGVILKPKDCFADDTVSRILISSSCRRTCGFCRLDPIDSLPRSGPMVNINVYTHRTFLNATEQEITAQAQKGSDE